MFNFLAALIVKLGIGILDYFLVRKGIRDGVKKDIVIAAERLAKHAEAYKAKNPINLPPDDILGPIRVRGLIPGGKPGVSPKHPGDSDSGRGTQ